MIPHCPEGYSMLGHQDGCCASVRLLSLASLVVIGPQMPGQAQRVGFADPAHCWLLLGQACLGRLRTGPLELAQRPPADCYLQEPPTKVLRRTFACVLYRLLECHVSWGGPALDIARLGSVPGACWLHEPGAACLERCNYHQHNRQQSKSQ